MHHMTKYWNAIKKIQNDLGVTRAEAQKIYSQQKVDSSVGTIGSVGSVGPVTRKSNSVLNHKNLNAASIFEAVANKLTVLEGQITTAESALEALKSERDILVKIKDVQS